MCTSSFQHVMKPTRGNNILVSVISSESMIEDLKIMEHFSTSDHNMVSFKVVLESMAKDVVVQKNNFRKGDYESMRMVLKDTNWDQLFEGKDK